MLRDTNCLYSPAITWRKHDVTSHAQQQPAASPTWLTCEQWCYKRPSALIARFFRSRVHRILFKTVNMISSIISRLVMWVFKPIITEIRGNSVNKKSAAPGFSPSLTQGCSILFVNLHGSVSFLTLSSPVYDLTIHQFVFLLDAPKWRSRNSLNI